MKPTLREFKDMIRPLIEDRIKTKVVCTNINSEGDDICAYRGNKQGDDVRNENVCFVGKLITPENYKPSLEAKNGNSEPVMKAIKSSLGIEKLPSGSADFILELQRIHDRVHIYGNSMKSWKQEVETLFNE